MPLKQRVFIGLAVGLMVAIGVIAWAGPPTFPEDWDAGYEADPVAADPVSAGDDHFRGVKRELRWRLDKEIDFSTLGLLGTQTGEFHEGSARAFKVANCTGGGPPTVPAPPLGEYDPTAPAYAAVPTLDADDDGALCKDDTTGELEIWDEGGLAFEQAVQAYNDDIDIIDAAAPAAPAVGHTLNGGSEMYLHGHAARHIDTDTAGTDGDEFDYIPNGIIDIVEDSTCLIGNAACITDAAGACVADAVGRELDGVLSVTTANMAARRGTSHGLVYFFVPVGTEGGINTCEMEVIVDVNDAVDIDSVMFSVPASQTKSVSGVFHVTSLAAAGAHVIDLDINHAELAWCGVTRVEIEDDDPGDAVIAAANRCRLVWVDLGLE